MHPFKTDYSFTLIHMEADCTYLSYSSTGRFSKIVTDYISKAEILKPFYKYDASIQGITKSIEARKQFPHRQILVDELRKQYNGLEIHSSVAANIEALQHQNTFTVTTAHQPNIFTGPLYFIYKILHAVQLANELSVSFKDCRFVPVYYMGSEDADFDELSFINIEGKKYQWQTKQSGAVGRMKVDKALISLIDEMHGQLGVQPYGDELINIFKKYYTENKTIQEATLELVNDLFGEYGLIVLIPDNANLKRIFIPVIEKELTEQFSQKAVEETGRALQEHYKLQATGRDINLFYLTDDKRERIEKNGDEYSVHAADIHFTKDELLARLQANPECFSPNVILRGAFQESILPNIAFIGGGGEIAYWLQLKNVFDAVSVPYPVLVLRNSFAILEEKYHTKMQGIGLEVQDLFSSEFDLMNKIVLSRTKNKTDLKTEMEKLDALYQNISAIAAQTDKTLTGHVEALHTKALHKLEGLEKKMLRAEKRKYETEKETLQKIMSQLFPGNSLQERNENISSLYAHYGRKILNIILKHSKGLKQEFGVINI